jgi:hypothetical protein
MDKTTRGRVIEATVSNVLLALTDNDHQSQQRHVIAAGFNGGRLLPGAVRATWRFYRTHSGNPGSMPGPGGH